MVSKTCFPVRHTEIDSLGIVHHSNYPIWFERGRSDYLKNANVPNYKMNALGFFLPLSEMNCEFKSPVKYGDEIMVITKLSYMSCVKIKFEYKIQNNLNGRLLANGKTVHAWTNKNIEPINIEKAAPDAYRQLKQLVELTSPTFYTTT